MKPLGMKVMLIEDSPVYRKIIGDYLAQWGFELIAVSDGAQAWELLQQPGAPRLILLDWVLPGMDGIELCKRLRKRSVTEAYTYTLLLTAKTEKTDLLEGMAAGADDFLTKPFDGAELKARLFAGKRILDLQEQLLSARESLRFAATHDALTGLWNRAEVLEFLKKELARARRENKPVGVMLADIDHFKSINDTFGHVTGDKVLKEASRALCSGLRVYDGAGRYGGEEFLMILPGCDLATTFLRANELRAAVAEIPLEQSKETRVTISVGVTAGIFAADVDIENILANVDKALYAAKRKGRDRVEKAAPLEVPQNLSFGPCSIHDLVSAPCQG